MAPLMPAAACRMTEFPERFGMMVTDTVSILIRKAIADTVSICILAVQGRPAADGAGRIAELLPAMAAAGRKGGRPRKSQNQRRCQDSCCQSFHDDFPPFYFGCFQICPSACIVVLGHEGIQ